MPSSNMVSFPYYGGKQNAVNFIKPLLPQVGGYVEPYCGAATILLNRSRSKVEVLNDINGDIVSFFRVLRNAPELLLRLLYLTPYSRDEFDEATDMLKDECSDISDVEWARLWYLHQSGAVGDIPSDKASLHTAANTDAARSSAHSMAQRLGNLLESNEPFTLSDRLTAWDIAMHSPIGLVADRLRGVVIENKPALEVIKQYDRKQTLIYCDLPYVHASRTTKGGYSTEMTDDDHISLARALHNIKGLAAISGYSSDLYDELYADWNRFDANSKSTPSSVMGASFTQGDASNGGKRQEVLWTNYHPAEYGLGVLF